MKKIFITSLIALLSGYTTQAQESESSYNSKSFSSFRVRAIGGDVNERIFSLGAKLGINIGDDMYIGPVIAYEKRTSSANDYTFESQLLEYGLFFRNGFPITKTFSFTGDVQASFIKDLENSDNDIQPFTGLISINAEYRPIESFSVRLLMGQLAYQAVDTESAWQLGYGLQSPAIEFTHYF